MVSRTTAPFLEGSEAPGTLAVRGLIQPLTGWSWILQSISWNVIFREPDGLCQLELWAGVVAGVVALLGHQLRETLGEPLLLGPEFPHL